MKTKINFKTKNDDPFSTIIPNINTISTTIPYSTSSITSHQSLPPLGGGSGIVVDLVVGNRNVNNLPFVSEHWKHLTNHSIIDIKYLPQSGIDILDIASHPETCPAYYRMRVKASIIPKRSATVWCDNWGSPLKPISANEYISTSPVVSICLNLLNEEEEEKNGSGNSGNSGKDGGHEDFLQLSPIDYLLSLTKYKLNKKTGDISTKIIFEKKISIPFEERDYRMTSIYESNTFLHFQNVLFTMLKVFFGR